MNPERPRQMAGRRSPDHEWPARCADGRTFAERKRDEAKAKEKQT